MQAQGTITLDDGRTAEFHIGADGGIFRWGDASALGEVVGITEALRDAMREAS